MFYSIGYSGSLPQVASITLAKQSLQNKARAKPALLVRLRGYVAI